MTGSEITAERPMRHISSWKVFGVFCLVVFLFFFGVVFIPWDVKAPGTSDLNVKIPALSPEENAFTWFEQATRNLVEKVPNRSTGYHQQLAVLTLEDGCTGEMGWDSDLASDVLTVNAVALSDLDKGLACQRYASPKQDIPGKGMPWMDKYRNLARLLGVKSMQAQMSGDSKAAALSALQGFSLGRLILNDSNCFMEWLTGNVCAQIALARMEEVAADAKTPDSVLMEILTGLDQWNMQGIVAGCQNAMRGEYARNILMIDSIRTGKFPEKYLQTEIARRVPYLLKPNMANRDFATVYRHHINNASLPLAKAKSDYPGQPALLDSDIARAAEWLRPNSVGRLLLWLVISEPESLLQRKTHLESKVIVLRLKIALRLYEQKHGQLPDDLKALIPELLKEIPQDPYDGQPFRYSKQEKKVWAVGYDLKDDGGKMKDNVPMWDRLGYDVVMPLGTREIKPVPLPPPEKPLPTGSPF